MGFKALPAKETHFFTSSSCADLHKACTCLFPLAVDGGAGRDREGEREKGGRAGERGV